MRTRTRRVHPWKCKYGLLKNVPLKWWKCKNLRNTPKLSFQRRGDRESRWLRKGTIATLSDSDVPEVIMKRTQQEAQAKAAKHCSTENRQQEAQAMTAKHWFESLRSTRSAVSTRYCCLLCIHVQIFDVHTVIVIRACTTWGHIITHFWPTMTSVVMVLNLLIYFRSVSCKCPGDNPDRWQCDGQKGSIPVDLWHCYALVSGISGSTVKNGVLQNTPGALCSPGY